MRESIKHINLCDTCTMHIATCTVKYPYEVSFGSGESNDNIIKCKHHHPRTKEKPKS